VETSFFQHSFGISYVGSHPITSCFPWMRISPQPPSARLHLAPQTIPLGFNYYPASAPSPTLAWNSTHWFSQGVSSYHGLKWT